jgi:hypothetical protein
MKTRILSGIVGIVVCGGVFAQDKPELGKGGVDPNLKVNGAYRGRFTPDAEYVLSGQLAKDVSPLPKVPFNFDAPGFREDRLSKVPPVGVHPRIVLSPCDIEEIKANIAKGDKASSVFRIYMRELRNKASKPGPARENFNNAPSARLRIPSELRVTISPGEGGLSVRETW